MKKVADKNSSRFRLWLYLSIASIVSISTIALTSDSLRNAYRRSTGEKAEPDEFERTTFSNLYEENQKANRWPHLDALDSAADKLSDEERKEVNEMNRFYFPQHLSRTWKPSWEWKYIKRGDIALVAELKTSFEREFYNAFKGTYNSLQGVEPDRNLIVTEVISRLFEDLGRTGKPNAREIVEEISAQVTARYARDRNARDTWYFPGYSPKHFTENEAKPGMLLPFSSKKSSTQLLRGGVISWENAVSSIPEAYALYFRSLTEERGRAIRLMQELIELDSEHADKLKALARYRRARLLMNLEDWDIISDDEAKERIRLIKRDLRAVPELVERGALNPQRISESSPYWIAYSESMILRPDRLLRIGEADFSSAFRTYLSMPQVGAGNAYNSSLWLAQRIASSREVVKCASDPLLRELITIYYASSLERWVELTSEHEKKAYSEQVALWLDALESEPSAKGFSPAKIALLQQRIGRWDECFRTAGTLEPGDPLRSLLRSRCVLRMRGDVKLARKILDAGLGMGSPEFDQPRWSENAHKPPAEERVFVNLSDPGAIRARVEGERALMALSQGEFSVAYVGFHRSGAQRETEYVGECLLTTNEMRSSVLSMGAAEIKETAFIDPDCRKELNPMEHLISRLFRDGRTREAMALMDERLRNRTKLFLKLVAMGEDEGLERRSRASAYWRAACLSELIGRRLFRSPVGSDHSDRWLIPYDFLPWVRYSQACSECETYGDEKPSKLNPTVMYLEDFEKAERQGAQVLIRVTRPEAERLSQWMNVHLTRSCLFERDPFYELSRLALKAVQLLPDNDQKGAQILQYVGRHLKFDDPKGAQPAYRVLATRFKETTYGNHAFKHRWLSHDYPYPGPYILEER